MGNTQSKIIGSFYYVAYCLSGFIITLVCLFGISGGQLLHVCQLARPVHAQAAPTVALGTTTNNMGTSGSFGNLLNARLDASGTKVLMADSSQGPVISNAAPYAFLRRATSLSTQTCSFDGTEASSESTARIYCRYYNTASRFVVFKFSDISVVRSSDQDPLIKGSPTVAFTGMVEFVSGTNYLFIASSEADGTLYRVDTSSFTYSGTVSSTVTAQDPGNTGVTYRHGVCDSGTYCYVLSTNFKVARFSQGTSSADASHDSTIDLSANDKMTGGTGTSSVSVTYVSVAIDSNANNLFVATSGGGNVVCKIALSSFTFSSRVVLSGFSGDLVLCKNCLSSSNEFLTILLYSAKKTSTIRVSDTTELTDSSTSPADSPSTAWILQSSDTGAIVTADDEVVSLTITNPTTTTATAPSSNSNNATESDSTNVVIIAVSSSVGGLALIGGGMFLIIYFIRKKKEEEELEAAEGKEPLDSSELKEVVSNEPHAHNKEEDTPPANVEEKAAKLKNKTDTDHNSGAPTPTNDSSASTPSTSSQTTKNLIDKTDDDDDDAAAVTVSVNAPPPSRCFKKGVPDKNLEDAVRALLSIKDAPSNRPDLKKHIPDKKDPGDLLHYLEFALPELKNRPAIQKLIAENGLTDDDIKILHSYKIQNPYPVYLWLNGWLGGDRRDDFVKEHVAPLFVLLYRAMDKLPKFKAPANRAIKVNNIPSLKSSYDEYEKVCAPGQILSFWGFSSFSTKADVINREEFVGKPNDPAIIYSCGELEGVDMEPFSPKGLKDESEILPLCPCVLKVANSVKVGQKLVISVTPMDHVDFAYVDPQ